MATMQRPRKEKQAATVDQTLTPQKPVDSNDQIQPMVIDPLNIANIPAHEEQKAVIAPTQQKPIHYQYDRMSWNNQQLLAEQQREYQFEDQNFSNYQQIAFSKPLYTFGLKPYNSYEMEIEMKDAPG